ncbi:DUF4956 domain-containing protein [Pelagicoccus albus]|uniref:DUF4956 domain-containing protein n=1 Tax=Pelagicoccus albus TaxID=415222 RepID=A0A7X1E965_9BACT|nr:DUF4956 domain-containing protein [Pelagicoccus albus]MBC2607099.1 DUF4956 domain-containing protein [Pelagicoccus albus]
MTTTDFLSRFGIFFAGILILLRGIYFRKTPDRETFFGFFLFGNGVFLVTYFLHHIDMSMGFAFGLFAVFAMLRYRTESISIKDMTYLFVVIVIALITSVSSLQYWETGSIVAFICFISWLGETTICKPRLLEFKVAYDRVDNLAPSKRHELHQDLGNRLGLDVLKTEINKIDYLNNSAQLVVFYSNNEQSH